MRARSNLTIISGATVTDIKFDGRRATGVSANIGGEARQFTGREIIVSLGGIHSPAMLMRCGIGPAAHLREHGIAVRADMPGVGANLSNHSLLFIGFHLQPEARQSPDAAVAFGDAAPLLVRRAGLPARPTCTSTCRARPRGARSARGSPISRRRCGSRWGAAGWRCVGADHRQEPLVEMNFAGHELDLKRLMVGFRLAVEMLAYHKVRAMSGVTFPVKFTDRLRQLNQKTTANAVKAQAIAWLTDMVPALAEPVFGTLADRRVDLTALVKDDDALAEHIRQNVAGMFHVAGTCRMGASTDRDAVVDRDRAGARLRRACAWSMPRSCRRCRAPTPTSRPSCWPRRSRRGSFRRSDCDVIAGLAEGRSLESEGHVRNSVLDSGFTRFARAPE